MPVTAICSRELSYFKADRDNLDQVACTRIRKTASESLVIEKRGMKESHGSERGG